MRVPLTQPQLRDQGARIHLLISLVERLLRFILVCTTRCFPAEARIPTLCGVAALELHTCAPHLPTLPDLTLTGRRLSPQHDLFLEFSSSCLYHYQTRNFRFTATYISNFSLSPRGQRPLVIIILRSLLCSTSIALRLNDIQNLFGC